ncbi:fungal-specific transcription factor domain-containing protein [Ampelomyces quisqualis]|uniref:Fungal-specific transcription factor domain-containing protein n=1 Tax=Ampelomyces quisqualis TaxID=50730 RepID=A0A6A5QME6_AMPQU|nr:fungal-specific transcription factor domain-containing protein [Ampelomyces quisqualis]
MRLADAIASRSLSSHADYSSSSWLIWRRATQLNHRLTALLRDLSRHVDSRDQKRIADALNEANDDLVSQGTASSRQSLGKHARQPGSSDEDSAIPTYGEALITGTVGSNEDIDHINDDLMRTRESRETGYVGQNSVVQWLSSVQRQTERIGAEPHGQPYGPPGLGQTAVSARSDALHVRQKNARDRETVVQHITNYTFYLDSDELDFDIITDPYMDPEPEVAKRLFNCYLQTVHPSFPLVPETFVHEFDMYIHAQQKSVSTPAIWRAQMNLLFAIGAQYSHLINADWAEDERDHRIYMNRAVRLLGLKDTLVIISGPDLRTVQATGALSFYFLAIGRVSRAWITIGLSIRLALSLGLHLRNENYKATMKDKDSHVHTWWVLHCIECLINNITGRPPVVAFEDCTVSLPNTVPTEHQKSTFSLPQNRTGFMASTSMTIGQTSEQIHENSTQRQYLLDHINVTIISQKALIEIYSPRTAAKSWKYVQNEISKSLESLEAWSNATLPQTFRKWNKAKKSEFDRTQFLLRTEYWSTKMLITRPCLCRIERHIVNESDTSAGFNISTAEACVAAALGMVNLFPDEPDIEFVYSQGPWWAITHFIMQSIAVLLLELTYQKKDKGSTKPHITMAIKKMDRWLKAMSTNDPVAAKACAVFQRILQGMAPNLQAQANDILGWPEVPPIQPNIQDYLYQQPLPTLSGQTSNPTPEKDVSDDAGESSQSFDPQYFQHQVHDNLPNYAYDTNMFSPPLSYPARAPFGNPFFTDFDQNAPFADVQDVWAPMPDGTSGFDMNWMNVDEQQPPEHDGAGHGRDDTGA